MDVHCEIEFDVPLERADEFVLIIERMGLAEGWERRAGISLGPSFRHTFDADDGRIEELRAALATGGIECFRRYKATYVEEELMASELLLLRLLAAGRDATRRDADMFDFSRGCPRCHTGAPQVSPPRVRASALPKGLAIFSTPGLEYLVGPSLVEALRAASPTGCEFMRVSDSKGKLLDWWQIVPRFCMPRMSPEQLHYSRDFFMTSRKCPECKRDGWSASNEDGVPVIAYRRSQLGDSSIPDFAEMWECVGVSAFEVNGYLARGELLVSQRVFRLFRELRIPDMEFTPVRIVED